MTQTAITSIQETRAKHTESVRQRLAFIEKRDGYITPELVLHEARNPRSPLHSEFTWDDKVAAHEHRLAEARRIIALYWTEIRTEKRVIEVPYYVRDPSAEHGEQGYVSAASVREKPELALRVFLTELARATSYLERARSMAETLSVDLELENAIILVGALKESAERKIRRKA
jgi:hypothetical protein